MPTFALAAISQSTRSVCLCTCICQEFLETGRVGVAHMRYYMHPLYLFFTFHAGASSDHAIPFRTPWLLFTCTRIVH
ncbi:MAG: hypothetical protein BYD32DRAFT_424984, partial [Podila humilis]